MVSDKKIFKVYSANYFSSFDLAMKRTGRIITAKFVENTASDLAGDDLMGYNKLRAHITSHMMNNHRDNSSP